MEHDCYHRSRRQQTIVYFEPRSPYATIVHFLVTFSGNHDLNALQLPVSLDINIHPLPLNSAAAWIVYLHTGLGVIILPMVTFFDNFFLGGSSGMTRRRGQYFRTGMSQLEIGEQGEEVMNSEYWQNRPVAEPEGRRRLSSKFREFRSSCFSNL
ncbi:uncharacterized protein LACBIDRAFT_303907 [Laccaria bicolor S238N-H82]|uniref:Predicted protein n=1 Tax=Laccaria bicolor (strain S238N-H82 / ATCC MYA-4686) TaxID=486041 RepID=B0DKM6_LACBS|nr:uncharacterized protein LACBIDRAFT_303907 [Laccaria bicolor S238N-H82]EDR05091.1 predicted protein [Laccaria bicolor S238N-H82]|eukprot:XP_001884481.1 predicted protein [Laccaria bicolor S238N-H82]